MTRRTSTGMEGGQGPGTCLWLYKPLGSFVTAVASASLSWLILFVSADLIAGDQEPAATWQPFFERLDANKDGKITFAEVPNEGKMFVEFLREGATFGGREDPGVVDQTGADVAVVLPGLVFSHGLKVPNREAESGRKRNPHIRTGRAVPCPPWLCGRGV